MPETLEVLAQESFGIDFPPSSPVARTSWPSASGGSTFSADLGYTGEQREGAATGLIAAREGKMRADSFVDRQAESRMEEDRARMDRAYRAEGAAKDAMPPSWQADKERSERIRGPIEQFGSVGSVFAMMASAFTRTPMTSALNAGAAAMQAVQQHDEKGYESAYQAWKDNTNLAVKRFEMERSMFQDADKLMATDMQAWRAKRTAIAARFEDQKALTLLSNGMDPELLELDARKIDAVNKLRVAQQGFEEFNIQRRIFSDGVKAFRQSNPDAPPEQDVQNRLRLLHEIKSGARSWQQEALRNFELTHPNATSEERAEFMKALRGGVGKVTETDKTMQANVVAVREEHPDWSEDQVRNEATKRASAARTKTTEADKTMQANVDAVKADHPDWDDAQVRNEANVRSRLAAGKLALKSAGTIELQHQNPGMSLAEAAKKYDEINAPGSNMTKEAIDLNARLLIRGNPAAITNVGRGKQGEATLTAIKNRAADILEKERKLKPEEAATLINQNTAAFMGDKRGASNLALRMSTIHGAATTALATSDRVIETSEKVDRTNFSDLNKVLLSAQRRTGGTEVIDFGIAVNTLVNNYARAVGGGSAALTDTARREAHELLELAWSKGQIKSAVAQLKRELYFELQGAQEARKSWQEGTTPFPEGQIPDTTAPVIQYDNKGKRIK